MRPPQGVCACRKVGASWLVNSDEARAVAEAEGYLELRMFEDAWRFIETIPADSRMHPRIMTVRTACAMALDYFGMAESLALQLAISSRQDAAFAAHVLHRLAIIHHRAGDRERARMLVTRAIQVYPEERQAILENQDLKGLF